MKLRTMLASLVAVVMFTACEDIFEGGDLQPDGSNPSLTINNPSKNQSVTATSGLRVNITAVDKDNVERLNVALQGEEAEKAVINFSTEPGRKVVEYDTTLSVAGIAPGVYKLLISATDKRANLSTQEVTVNVK
ncbi:Ig-like domain-containing protein [Pontibacter anaerobius]|uniref:Ig-like domain-containing protein n=1 Tax=Pontibacter anaerobius TaxID=2993940 RepID=A0ABT3RIL6_9BACT|nr:Ig-like domain-containing protein [Pontibacter anaerobius]MCX2741070.1 Ig-like domain-containing protein [Pontibacter anaerobius]